MTALKIAAVYSTVIARPANVPARNIWADRLFGWKIIAKLMRRRQPAKT